MEQAAWQLEAISEEEFVQRVTSGVDTLAARHDGPIVVLFDIDYTLLFGSQGNEYLRSGFVPVIDTLRQQHGDRVDFGVLTVCSRKDCRPESNWYTPEIEPLMGVTNPAFMGHATFGDVAKDGLFNFKTQEFEWEYKYISAAYLQQQAQSHPVLEKIYPALKPLVLDRMMAMHPDTGFVVVEDSPWVLDLRGMHNRVEGVYVR